MLIGDSMLIGELSRLSGVSARSLRHYERIGLIEADRESNGYRSYDASVVDRAAVIHMLFGMDFPREAVRSVLSCVGPASTKAHEAMFLQLADVRDALSMRIASLVTARDRIDAALAGRMS